MVFPQSVQAANQEDFTYQNQMNYLNKQLIIIYICLTLTYAHDILEQQFQIDTIIPQLIMLAFANISVIAAFLSKKWFGQILLYTNFLLVGLIPLILGIISLWLTSQKVKALLKYSSAGIPLILMFFPVIAHILGGMPNNWEPNFQFVIYRLIQAIYWYTVFLYTSTHLKQELEKIEQK